MFCGLTRKFVTYWDREQLPKSSSCLSTHSLLSVCNLKLKVICTCFHSLPLASRPGKNNSEGFCKITASGYRENVLICWNTFAYIIALFFPFWTCPSKERVPLSPLDFSFYRNKCHWDTICNSPWWQRQLLGISNFLTHGLTWHCVSDAFVIDFNVWWLFVLRWLSLHICVFNHDLSDSSWVPCCGKYWITEWTQLPIFCILDITLEISNNFQINNELIITLI